MVSHANKGVSRMQVPLAARHKPTGNQNKATKGVICFGT